MAPRSLLLLKRVFALLVLLTLVSAPPLGSGTATLKCTSPSGRTEFVAKLQDISGMFEGGWLTIDGHRIDFPADDGNMEHHTIWDKKNGVFTMSYYTSTSEGPRHFRFWAIPSTFRSVSGDRNVGARYTFEARLEATDPRPGQGPGTPTITLNGTLEYRI